MDKIIYNIASYKRPDTLFRTIDSIYNQCDKINLSLNNYEEIPVELYDKKINLFITDNEKGDAYKFYSLNNSDGYYFTIDDDLIYPPNYTKFMVDNIEKYKRKSIITLHGRNFGEFPILSYYRNSKKIFHFSNNQSNDEVVQVGGTGVMAFHTDLFKVPIDYFRHPNMADIWISKLAKEKNIKIICVKKEKDFVKQQQIEDSIFSEYNKNDEIQTEILNKTYEKKELSIIVPTYQNTDFLDDCLNSIINSCGKYVKYEILVGIDKCEETLKYIKNKEFNPSIRFFYFEKNVGPYVVKNTLSKEAKSDILLFFDSDDIMRNNMITDCISYLKDYDLMKPMFKDFSKIKQINDYDDITTRNWGEGVFAIKKSIFLYHNGFEDWRCAADSDFMGRLYKNKIKLVQSNDLMFYRRIHDRNLTIAPGTNYGSKLRRDYAKLSKQKTDFGPLPKLVTCDFKEVFVKYYLSSKQEINEEVIKQEKKEQLISSLNIPKISTKKIEPSKQTPVEQPKHIHTIKQNVKKILEENTNHVSGKYSKGEVNKRRNEVINKIDRNNKNFFF